VERKKWKSVSKQLYCLPTWAPGIVPASSQRLERGLIPQKLGKGLVLEAWSEEEEKNILAVEEGEEVLPEMLSRRLTLLEEDTDGGGGGGGGVGENRGVSLEHRGKQSLSLKNQSPRRTSEQRIKTCVFRR